MKKHKKLIAAGALALGIGAGAAIATPIGMNAAGNVVLASVDWVTTQLNPVKTKVADLESKVAKQQQEIDSLKAQIANLPSTPPPPPATGEQPAVVYAKSSVTIRSGASTAYKIVATKPAGSSLSVVDSATVSTGLWYRIQLSSTLYGWVFSGDVSVTKPAVTVPTQVVTSGAVNIRRGASTSYEIVESFKTATTFKYLGVYTNSKGEKWYNVESPSGKRGWLLSTLGEVR